MARQLGFALGVGQLGISLGDAHDGGVQIRAGEIDLLHSVGRHGLTGDDRVHLTGLHRGDQGIPIQTDHFQIPAVGFADLLGDHDVVAVGEFVGVLDGHGAVGVVLLGPVVGRVGALHGDGQHAVFHAGGNVGDGSRVGAGVGVVVSGFLGAGREQAQHHGKGENKRKYFFHNDILSAFQQIKYVKKGTA